MALRIKCKCGKSLKVSSKLADKKLLCPGCNKAFRIPAEKFKEAPDAAPARAAVIVKKPPASKPPTEVPMPAPVELDLLPEKIDWSSGDLSVSQSDILSGLIPDAKATASSPSSKLGLTCPLCRKTLAPGAVICMDCGFNVTTRTYIKSSLPPRAAAVASAPTATYASDRSWQVGARTGRLDQDVIQQPKRSFWANAFRAFAYPFLSISNGVVFGTIVLADFCRVFLAFAFALVPCIFIIPAIILGLICIRGWIAAVMLSVIQDTASGSEDLPGLKMQDGVMEDVLKPLLKYIGAAACAFLPASIVVILLGWGVLPDSLLTGLNIMLLIGAGVFVWPIFLMLFAFDAPGKIFRLDLIATTIFRTFIPYLCLWLMLMLASFGTILALAGIMLKSAGVGVTMPQLPAIPGFAGELVFSVVSLYFSLVSMRLIGLYYLHFKKRFTLVME